MMIYKKKYIFLSKNIAPQLIVNLLFIFIISLNLIAKLFSTNFTVIFTSISCLFCVFVSYYRNKSLSNWILIFFSTFFIFYFLGGFLGKVLVDINESYVNLPTNFNTGISLDSEFKAYNYSALVAQIILFFSFLFNCDDSRKQKALKEDIFLYKISSFLLKISIPLVLLNSFWELKYYLTDGFSLYYTKDFRFVSPIPFSAFFYNIYVFSSITFLLSKPTERNFNLFLIFYILISLIESLKGTRSVIIINILFILWYRADIYKKDKIDFKKLITFFVTFSIFLSFTGAVRQNVSLFGVIDIYNLILKGLSTAQYQLALYIENISLLENNQFYIFYPLLFPFYYIFWGNDIAYQSIERISLPMDINHTVSSKLNLGAYLMGAANGNNFVMELITSYFFLFWIFVFFCLNKSIFSNRNRSPLNYLMAMIFIKHLIASPRDSVFPNMWFIFKVLFFYAIITSIKLAYKSNKPNIKLKNN